MHQFLRPSILLILSLIPTSSPQFQPPPPTTTYTTYQNITTLMSINACKTFAELLQFSVVASDSFAFNVFSGITIFCPHDRVFDPFLPRFQTLTFDGKLSLLLYHAIPTYYSISMMKSGNGVVNTLATDGVEKNYNFTMQNDGDVVTLRTEVSTARITGTILDAEPVGLYSIDNVLMPEELFKKTAVDSPTVDGNKGLPEAAGPDGKAADNSGGGEAGKMIEFVVVAVFALFFV